MNADYNSCWNNFVWPSLESIDDPIMQKDVSPLVELIKSEINSSRAIADNLMGENPYELTELFETVIKVADNQKQSETPILIDRISKKEKIIACRVFTDLSKQEIDLTEKELKCATLLLGIHCIKKFVLEYLGANIRAPMNAYAHALPEDQPRLEGEASQAFVEALTDGCVVS
jgi:hypothetical protein